MRGPTDEEFDALYFGWLETPGVHGASSGFRAGFQAGLDWVTAQVKEHAAMTPQQRIETTPGDAWVVFTRDELRVALGVDLADFYAVKLRGEGGHPDAVEFYFLQSPRAKRRASVEASVQEALSRAGKDQR
jgi:hypothetical protein